MAGNSNEQHFAIYTGPGGDEAEEAHTTPSGTSQQPAAPASVDESDDIIYYFGVGPTVNPLVRKRQGVRVSEERAAVLPDHRLTFVYGGVANVVPKTGYEIHGVVMKLDSPEDWHSFREKNVGSSNIQVMDVYPYGSPKTPIRARVFLFENSLGPDGPTEQEPTERYLRLIADGLRHHKIEDDYIQYEIMEVSFEPCRRPKDYLKFPSNAEKDDELPRITFRKYQRMCRKSAGKAVYFIIGQYVFEMPYTDPENPAVKWCVTNCHGKADYTWDLHQIKVDPDVPLADTPEDLTPLHEAWAEDSACDFLQKCGMNATKSYRLVSEEEQNGFLSRICCRQ